MVMDAMTKGFENIFKELDNKSGEKTFELAQSRERRTRDLDQVKFIKEEGGQIPVEEAKIK